MILPIMGYGHPVLRKKAQPINSDYEDLPQLIENMFETMYRANGIGLAAPQVDLSIRLLVVDLEPMKEHYPEAEGFKRVLINPEIMEESGELWAYNEGCLSLPDIHEDVVRKAILKLSYFDENFVAHEEIFSGIRARVLQHEIDHLEGKVFVDRLSPLRKTLMKRRLKELASGKVHPSYKMRFSK